MDLTHDQQAKHLPSDKTSATSSNSERAEQPLMHSVADVNLTPPRSPSTRPDHYSRSAGLSGSLEQIMDLQQVVGNRAVQRLLSTNQPVVGKPPTTGQPFASTTASESIIQRVLLKHPTNPAISFDTKDNDVEQKVQALSKTNFDAVQQILRKAIDGQRYDGKKWVRDDSIKAIAEKLLALIGSGKEQKKEDYRQKKDEKSTQQEKVKEPKEKHGSSSFSDLAKEEQLLDLAIKASLNQPPSQTKDANEEDGWEKKYGEKSTQQEKVKEPKEKHDSSSEEDDREGNWKKIYSEKRTQQEEDPDLALAIKASLQEKFSQTEDTKSVSTSSIFGLMPQTNTISDRPTVSPVSQQSQKSTSEGDNAWEVKQPANVVIPQEQTITFQQQIASYRQHPDFQHGVEKHIGAHAKAIEWKKIHTAFEPEIITDKKKQKKVTAAEFKNLDVPEKTEDIAAAARVLFAVHPGKGNELDVKEQKNVEVPAFTKRAGGFKTEADFVRAERTVWAALTSQGLDQIDKLQAYKGKQDQKRREQEQRSQQQSMQPASENAEDEGEEADVTPEQAEKFKIKMMNTRESDKKGGRSYTGVVVYMPLSWVWPLTEAPQHLFGRELANFQVGGEKLPISQGPINEQKESKIEGTVSEISMQKVTQSGYMTQKVDYSQGGLITAIYRYYPVGSDRAGWHLTTMYVRPVARGSLKSQIQETIKQNKSGRQEKKKEKKKPTKEKEPPNEKTPGIEKPVEEKTS